MFEKEEEQLKKIKETYQETKLPSHIDSYIQAGIRQAEGIKKRKRRLTFSSVAVAMTCLLFLVFIRVSPVFASYVSQIPGLERFVALIQGDKGLESALDHAFFQEIGLSDTKQGITLTVDKIIPDDTKITLFYSIESDQDYSNIMLVDTEFTDEDNEDISAAFSFANHPDGIKKGETITGKIDIDFGPGQSLPKEIHLRTRFDVSACESDLNDCEEWEISFSIDQEKFAAVKKEYILNERITIEGQQITFKTATVYPTKIAIHIQYDVNNTMEVFGFDDLVAINDNGEEWASIVNGITGREENENEEIIYLQSNFFEQPEELFLQFSTIRALDKDLLDVVVDLEQGKLLERPNEQLELQKITTGSNAAYLEFSIQSQEGYSDDVFRQVLAHQYYDQDGNEYETHNGFGFRHTDDPSKYISFLSVDKPEDGGPITLKVIDYPTIISKNIKLRIK